MFRIRVSQFMELSSGLSSLAEKMEEIDQMQSGVRIPQELRDHTVGLFRAMGSDTSRVGFPLASITVKKIAALFESETATISELRALLVEVHSRIVDEASQVVFFSVDPICRDLVLGKALFGEEVTTAFPSAADDIEEAGMCLGLDRGTACVFHLMRAMEIALGALLTDMGEKYDPKQHPDWSAILARCSQHISSAGAKQDFYRDAMTTLTSVKHSWRNPTMHPRAVYTPEQAHDVWRSVSIFMRHLATRLAEKP